MKAFPALLFALAITAIIAMAMLVVGGNALLNTNSVPVLNSPASTVSNASVPSSDLKLAAAEQRISDMQKLINQYQTREQQYQTELQQAAQKINDANSQLAQDNQQLQVFQQVLTALQQRGIIRITQDGQIQLLQGGDGF
jgi:peptidoglycan hydrolase CwlO-like protein